jgi:GntR family transcriptional regulator
MAPGGKFSVEPLYLQVRNLLAQRIASGVWVPGSMLPNEMDLARELGVSPGTVRKALDNLESDRLVLRRQGRGTSVVDQASGDLASRFSNFRDAAGVRIAGDLELLTQTQDTPTPIERERLQLSAGEPVLRTTRLRRYQGHLYMHETVVLARGSGCGSLQDLQPGPAQRHPSGQGIGVADPGGGHATGRKAAWRRAAQPVDEARPRDLRGGRAAGRMARGLLQAC